MTPSCERYSGSAEEDSAIDSSAPITAAARQVIPPLAPIRSRGSPEMPALGIPHARDGTGTSSGRASTLTSGWQPQALQVTNSPRMPFWRISPSVIGRIGSSIRGHTPEQEQTINKIKGQTTFAPWPQPATLRELLHGEKS